MLNLYLRNIIAFSRFDFSNLFFTRPGLALILMVFCFSVQKADAKISACSFIITVDAADNVTCKGNKNGKISISVSGGTPGYSYSWSPGGFTTQDITGIGAGTYTVFVTDVTSCMDSNSVVITEPSIAVPLITPVIDGTNLVCKGDFSGSEVINTAALGGTLPYGYLWCNGSTTSSVTGLPAGCICVHISDANGCTADTTVCLTEPATSLVSSINATVYPGGYNIACKGESSGYIFTTVGGGIPSYTYLWLLPASLPLPNLPGDSELVKVFAGFYQLKVTDGNGCSVVDTITLTEPDTLLPLIEKVYYGNDLNITCYGICDGGVKVLSVLGGTPPFSFLWDNTVSGPVYDSLCVGEYLLHTVDANGCVFDTTAKLVGPTQIVVTSFTKTNITGCYGDSTGFISADSVYGGNPSIFGYTYSWSPSGQTTTSISGLQAGTYTLTVTDDNSCFQTFPVVLTQPDSLNSVPTISNVLCTGLPTGSVGVSVSGGTGSYTYLWSPGGQTTASITGLAIGTYCVHITDSNGCTTDRCYTVTEPPKLQIDSLVPTVYPGGWNVSCNGLSNGNITTFFQGGVAPYTYSWSSSDTTKDIFNIPVGTYINTIVDANGCVALDSVTITQPLPLNDTITSVTSVACFGDSTGVIVVSTTGGTPTYHYFLDSLNNPVANPITGLPVGTYTVFGVDSNGCMDSSRVEVKQPFAALNANITSNVVSCAGVNSGTATATPTGGTAPYTYSWSSGSGTNSTATGLAPGSYSILITDSKGCTFTVNTTIGQTTLAASVNTTIISCKNLNSGTATLTPAGGTAPYTYQWSDNQSTMTATGLAPGTYSVVLIDSMGCRDTVSAVLIGVNNLTASILTAPVVSCKNVNSGTATLTPTGGTQPYTYQWSDNQSTATATGLAPGTYSVVLIDSMGCTDTIPSVLIGVNNLTAGILTPPVASCKNINSGTATLTPTGGTQPYTYQWSDSQTTATATGLAPGTYSVVLIDSMGCTDTLSTVLINQNNLTANVLPTIMSCKNINSGIATVSVTGGITPYTYLWNNAQSTATITGLTPGTYSVVVLDSMGCTDSVASVLVNINNLTANISGAPIPSCTYINNGSATVTPTGGTLPYTYLWNDGQTTATAANLSPGSYSVILFDSMGCTDTIRSVVIDTNIVVAATAGPGDTICVQDFTGEYQLHALDPNPATGSWFVFHGNGFLSSQTDLNAYYQNVPKDTGYHIIQWIVVNNNCSDTANISLVISHIGRCLDLELPNGFSPNGDGPNDSYVIVGIERFPVNMFKVFNRWGNEVFSRENYQNHNSARNWAGQNSHGEPLPDGTYYVILVAEGGNVVRNTYVDMRK